MSHFTYNRMCAVASSVVFLRDICVAFFVFYDGKALSSKCRLTTFAALLFRRLSRLFLSSMSVSVFYWLRGFLVFSLEGLPSSFSSVEKRFFYKGLFCVEGFVCVISVLMVLSSLLF